MTETILVGDIGGTNSRLRLFSIAKDAEIATNATVGTLVFAKEYQNENKETFAAIIEEFFADVTAATGKPLEVPRAGSFAVAGPVDRNMVTFTNRSTWVIDGMELAKKFGIEQVTLVNDFVANGYGLLTLTDSETHTLQDVPAQAGAPIALIGAGTGLGQCFLTATPDTPSMYHTWPSEGGHTEFAPRTDLEVELLNFLKKKFTETSRVSVERICSGKGIANVYEFMRTRFPKKIKKEADDEIMGAGDMMGGAIAKHAVKGDTLCKWAMEIFASTYGSEAGAMALKYLCYGGIYIAGGIAPKNIPLLTARRQFHGINIGFMDAFHDKGRVSKLMHQMPVKIVLCEDLGQRGAHLLGCRVLNRLRCQQK